jgi:hypothetical protein
LRREPMSITDFIAEAERVVFENGYDEKALKEYMKPHVIGAQVKEFLEEKKLVANDAEYDEFFRGTLAFVVGDQQREMYKTKRIQQGKTRIQLQEEVYEEYKDEGEKAVGKMASKLHQMLTALGTNSDVTDRVGEVISFLKTKAPNLVELYNQRQAKKKEAKEKETEKESSTVSKEGILYPKFQEKLDALTRLKDIKEHILTAINKDGALIGEDQLVTICKKKFLEDGTVEDTATWTEQDVSEWIARNIEPFHSNEYAILGAKDEAEFKACLEWYTAKHPAGKEKQRMTDLKKVLTSEIPRSNFARTIAKKVRKGNMVPINTFFREINEAALAASKEKLEE